LPRYVFIDQESQHMYIFEQGTLVRDILCSAGLPDPDKYTPAWSGVVGKYWGTFFAFEVYADEAWYLYKSDGSILIHSLPYTLQDDAKVYQDRDALGVSMGTGGGTDRCHRPVPRQMAVAPFQARGGLAYPFAL
jgi:hypothetical protein